MDSETLKLYETLNFDTLGFAELLRLIEYAAMSLGDRVAEDYVRDWANDVEMTARVWVGAALHSNSGGQYVKDQ